MRKIIISGMLGNGLEWYDFAVYAYMITTISKLFFPAGDDTVALLATLGIYAVGFVARPFGGVLFGWIGDTLGRRTALVISIFMMAIPTGCIGLLPTYQQLGVVAPVLLIVLRLLQGLSLGGAFSGSITFLVEHSPKNKRGLIGSTTISSLCVGFLVGALVTLMVKAQISIEQFESWGWRIPFLLGMPIGFIGFYIRHHCEESPSYCAAKDGGTLSKSPVRDTLKHEWQHMLQSIGIYVTVTMPFYMVSAYFITFTERHLHHSKEDVLMLNMVVMLVLLVSAPFAAWLSDQIGRKKVLVTGALLFLFASYPVFSLMLQPGFTPVLIAQAMFAFMVGYYTGPVPTVLVEIFPTRVRYTGMALSYNISAALFGGTTPMVCEWLIKETGNFYSIIYYVMICSVITLFTLYFYRERYQDDLD